MSPLDQSYALPPSRSSELAAIVERRRAQSEERAAHVVEWRAARYVPDVFRLAFCTCGLLPAGHPDHTPCEVHG